MNTPTQTFEFTTPTGVLVFPKLNAPDCFFKAHGEYSTRLRLNREAPGVESLIRRLKEIHSQALGLAHQKRNSLEVGGIPPINGAPFFRNTDDNGIRIPDYIELNFKIAASKKFTWGPDRGKILYYRPAIIGPDGASIIRGLDGVEAKSEDDKKTFVMPLKPEISGGTFAKVNFEVVTIKGAPGFYIERSGLAGISLRLKCVRIVRFPPVSFSPSEFQQKIMDEIFSRHGR